MFLAARARELYPDFWGVSREARLEKENLQNFVQKFSYMRQDKNLKVFPTFNINKKSNS